MLLFTEKHCTYLHSSTETREIPNTFILIHKYLCIRRSFIAHDNKHIVKCISFEIISAPRSVIFTRHTKKTEREEYE